MGTREKRGTARKREGAMKEDAAMFKIRWQLAAGDYSVTMR